jgi:hypothetical protein
VSAGQLSMRRTAGSLTLAFAPRNSLIIGITTSHRYSSVQNSLLRGNWTRESDSFLDWLTQKN